jgi:hypothetical protein
MRSREPADRTWAGRRLQAPGQTCMGARCLSKSPCGRSGAGPQRPLALLAAASRLKGQSDRDCRVGDEAEVRLAVLADARCGQFRAEPALLLLVVVAVGSSAPGGFKT